MRRALALLVVLPVVAATVVAGLISAPSKTRPCVTEFSKGFTGSPTHVTLGSDGNIWATEGNDRIARLDVKTQKVTEFPVQKGTLLHDLVAGPDGDMWFVGITGRLGKLDIETHEVTLYPGISRGAQAHHLWWAPDGMLYISELVPGRLARFDPRTKRITESRYNLPPDSGIHQFVEMPDGKTWWALSGADRLARFDPKAQRFDKFVRMPKSSGPRWFAHVRSDRALWVALGFSNQLARYDLKTEEVTIIDTPVEPIPVVSSEEEFIALFRKGPVSQIVMVQEDAEGKALWIPTLAGGELLRFDLKTHEFTRVGCGLSFPSILITMTKDRAGDLWVSAAAPGLPGGARSVPGRVGRVEQ